MLLEEAAKEQKRFPTADEQATAAGANPETNAHGQFTKMCGLIKTMFEKISTLLFDQETVSKLLKLIFERVSNGKRNPLNGKSTDFAFWIRRTGTTSLVLRKYQSVIESFHSASFHLQFNGITRTAL